MGIRYYAYAFDSDRTDEALRDPDSVLGPDPFADGMGIPRGARSGITDFQQSLPEEDMLYLDKAWYELQRLTWPEECIREARPAFRMFEGSVRMCPGGGCWESWKRVIVPEDVKDIAVDLSLLAQELRTGATRVSDGRDERITRCVERASTFVDGVATRGRGFVYMIG
jgi:hypothetical protein